MEKIQAKARAGEFLEEQIFFSDGKTMPIGATGQLDSQGRARFAGCAYCHEVTPQGEAVPRVTKPVLPDRWLIRGEFNHARHTSIDCLKCHAGAQSQKTSDILLPTQASCAECHSPKGGVAFTCTTCHHYHARQDVRAAQ
jgi:hypothetical protein